MAKNRLKAEFDYDFQLYGIITHLKSYRLAWLLNQNLNLHLIKQEDIVHEFINNEKITISNYLFETENAQFRLLKNKSENKNSERSAFLLPELHKFDFFIIKNGALDGKKDDGFFQRLKDIDDIQYITSFQIENLKSKENLIF